MEPAQRGSSWRKTFKEASDSSAAAQASGKLDAARLANAAQQLMKNPHPTAEALTKYASMLAGGAKLLQAAAVAKTKYQSMLKSQNVELAASQQTELELLTRNEELSEKLRIAEAYQSMLKSQNVELAASQQTELELLTRNEELSEKLRIAEAAQLVQAEEMQQEERVDIQRIDEARLADQIRTMNEELMQHQLVALTPPASPTNVVGATRESLKSELQQQLLSRVNQLQAEARDQKSIEQLLTGKLQQAEDALTAQHSTEQRLTEQLQQAEARLVPIDELTGQLQRAEARLVQAEELRQTHQDERAADLSDQIRTMNEELMQSQLVALSPPASPTSSAEMKASNAEMKACRLTPSVCPKLLKIHRRNSGLETEPHDKGELELMGQELRSSTGRTNMALEQLKRTNAALLIEQQKVTQLNEDAQEVGQDKAMMRFWEVQAGRLQEELLRLNSEQVETAARVPSADVATQTAVVVELSREQLGVARADNQTDEAAAAASSREVQHSAGSHTNAAACARELETAQSTIFEMQEKMDEYRRKNSEDQIFLAEVLRSVNGQDMPV